MTVASCTAGVAATCELTAIASSPLPREKLLKMRTLVQVWLWVLLTFIPSPQELLTREFSTVQVLPLPQTSMQCLDQTLLIVQLPPPASTANKVGPLTGPVASMVRLLNEVEIPWKTMPFVHLAETYTNLVYHSPAPPIVTAPGLIELWAFK